MTFTLHRTIVRLGILQFLQDKLAIDFLVNRKQRKCVGHNPVRYITVTTLCEVELTFVLTTTFTIPIGKDKVILK